MPAQFLERAFPHSDPWNDTSLLDASLGWDAPYFSRDLACGAIRVANAGCERYVLLAVAGPQHGMVWVDARADRAGIYPLRDRGGEAVSCRAFLRRRTPFRP